MTLDWSKATKGAKVKYKSEGSWGVNECRKINDDDYLLYLEGFGYERHRYSKDGRIQIYPRTMEDHPLDIIEIIPAPEPRKFEFWVNVYLSKRGVVWFGSTHTSKEDVEESVVYTDDTRIACVHHIGKEGDGL